jgi:pyruvate/2-oxoglutarate dehydrogenase complex dihydrolipoamide dehydrogenase (E3) component
MGGPAETYDVVVIGAGPAGEVVAGRIGDAGLRVAVVEAQLVGGECSYWGCVPSKVLLRPGDVRAAANRVPGLGQAGAAPVDVPAVLAWRDRMTGGWDDTGQVPWLADHQVHLVRGRARVVAPHRIEVRTSTGDVRTLHAQRAVVVATGSRAALPPIPGLARARPWDNRDVTALKAVPRRLVVLGGGAVGAEMAQAVRRLGAEQVTLIEAAPRLLAREEPFAGMEVAAGLRADGVDVRVGITVTAVERAGDDGPVTVTAPGGPTIEADEILVAAGRRPATDDLGLDGVGLAPGRFLEVDEHLRVRDVHGGWLYAVGDVNGLALLTHMGKYQARIAADAILGRPAADRASRDVVPRVTFTDPQVAAVGLTRAQAEDRGLTVRTVQVDTGGVAGAATQGQGLHGTSHLVIDETRRLIVGATFTGPATQELVHAATIAIAGRVGLDDLWHAVPAFPTVSEVWLRLLEAYGL